MRGFFGNDATAQDFINHVENHGTVAETDDICWNKAGRCFGAIKNFFCGARIEQSFDAQSSSRGGRANMPINDVDKVDEKLQVRSLG